MAATRLTWDAVGGRRRPWSADPVPALPTVAGDRPLPPPFDHPHASAEARAVAERGTILRAKVGSGVHGTSVAGQDDRDEMGICLEPP